MAQDLYNTLMNLQCELVAERNLVNPEQISWLQYDILNILQSEASRPTVMSRQLGITQVKLSKNLKKLRELDYITQTPDANDRREITTALTPKGQQFLSDIATKHRELYNKACKVWSKEEQQQFMIQANKLIDLLRKERIADDQ